MPVDFDDIYALGKRKDVASRAFYAAWCRYSRSRIMTGPWGPEFFNSEQRKLLTYFFDEINQQTAHHAEQ